MKILANRSSTTVACSRRSDSGARAKNKASERAGKNEPRFFPLFRSLSFSLALYYLNAWNRLKRLKILYAYADLKFATRICLAEGSLGQIPPPTHPPTSTEKRTKKPGITGLRKAKPQRQTNEECRILCRPGPVKILKTKVNNSKLILSAKILRN